MSVLIAFLEAVTDAIGTHALSIRLLNLRSQRQFLRMRTMERRLRALENLIRPM